MGILSRLLGNIKKSDAVHDSYSTEVNKCMFEVKLTASEFDLMAMYYYKGSTSYRDFFEHVFMGKSKKIKEVARKAEKQSKKGCNIDFTFVRFIHSTNRYIDIPFDVFSEKRNMTIRRRNNKLWNRANIKRILADNPGLRMFDEEMMEESIKKIKSEILK